MVMRSCVGDEIVIRIIIKRLERHPTQGLEDAPMVDELFAPRPHCHQPRRLGKVIALVVCLERVNTSLKWERTVVGMMHLPQMPISGRSHRAARQHKCDFLGSYWKKAN